MSVYPSVYLPIQNLICFTKTSSRITIPMVHIKMKINASNRYSSQVLGASTICITICYKTEGGFFAKSRSVSF